MPVNALVNLYWNAAIHKYGVKLYNIYQNNVMIGQTVDLDYQTNITMNGSKYSYYVVALCNDDSYLKSNTIEFQTSNQSGGDDNTYAFDYTLDFTL